MGTPMSCIVAKGACCDGSDPVLHQGVSICVEPSPLGATVVGLEERDEILHQFHAVANFSKFRADTDHLVELGSVWTGFREFVVMSRQVETSDIMSFFLKSADCPQETFSFVPGQALRLKVDPDGTGAFLKRDYTVVSQPGEDFLQIAVKRLPFGKVSCFLHEKAEVGSRVLVAKPAGEFTARPSEESTAVFLSAGIGITPMVALLQELGDRVVLAAHVDKTEEAHAFRHMFKEAGIPTQVQYTRKNGRPPRDIGARLVRTAGPNHDWYICGPRGFMNDAVDTLCDAGVDLERVHVESFRPAPQPPSSPIRVVQTVPQYGCWVPRQAPSTNRLKGA